MKDSHIHGMTGNQGAKRFAWAIFLALSISAVGNAWAGEYERPTNRLASRILPKDMISGTNFLWQFF